MKKSTFFSLNFEPNHEKKVLFFHDFLFHYFPNPLRKSEKKVATVALTSFTLSECKEGRGVLFFMISKGILEIMKKVLFFMIWFKIEWKKSTFFMISKMK